MTLHECPRCGHQTARRSWPQRHPYAAALAAIPTIYTLASITLAYPWFAIPLLIVGAAVWIDRGMRRRAAMAARAEYEYRELMLAAARDQRPYVRSQSQQRPRGADHWSRTQPIQAGRN